MSLSLINKRKADRIVGCLEYLTATGVCAVCTERCAVLIVAHLGHDVAEYCSVVLPKIMHRVVTESRVGENRFAHFKKEDIQYAITLTDSNVWDNVQHSTKNLSLRGLSPIYLV